MKDIQFLLERFHCHFVGNDNSPKVFFAPGRINLIGEHTDYNGGFVMPLAFQLGTYIVTAPSANKCFRFYSENFKSHYEHPYGLETSKGKADWFKYPMGVVDRFVRHSGWPDCGWDLYFFGDLPLSAGLSSSASIEMVTAVAMDFIFQSTYPMIELVKIAKEAENEFVGLQCGILDMFASGMGRKGHCLLIDCNSMEFSTIPFKTGDYRLIIMNTNKRRGLADSKYNERVKECEQALADLRQEVDIDFLCALSYSDFQKDGAAINNPMHYKRARHVISENQRTQDAAQALIANDIRRFGKLMVESHKSLHSDYEVTGLELDTLVEASMEAEGVMGARMTGAGFGGCAIALVHRNHISKFQHHVEKVYLQKTGLKVEFYDAYAVNGACRIL